MRIAITGGTGFVGRHLARALASEGHDVVLVARGIDRRDPTVAKLHGARTVKAGVMEVETLRNAFAGCDAVAHCAGINRQIGAQTYPSVHVKGTANVITAARAAGVRKIVMLSFLRARPACGSPYHESKWAAEELVRKSGLDYTVVKASMTFGPGDHMLDHLSHLLYTLPVFVTVGLREKLVRPVAVQDVVQVLAAALIGGRLSRQTVAVLGPETLRLSEVAKRVGRLIGKHALVVPAPAAVNYVVAGVAERVMRIPLASLAQVRMLDEGLVEPWGNVDPLPEDLVPRTPLSDEVLRAGLPTAGPFTRADLRIPGVI
ncbi:MAG: NAD-dependent epimerase/dehydratase family protein [Chloroflexi bacterium]|nr:MAG: NAD-dependent epimerase/dehydratase family protein [Chloroflexota bacterium]TME44728.1 MAG: NAD-dependent epimerase/dehydratase family protein [Chloroflexota bacterium]